MTHPLRCRKPLLEPHGGEHCPAVAVGAVVGLRRTRRADVCTNGGCDGTRALHCRAAAAQPLADEALPLLMHRACLAPLRFAGSARWSTAAALRRTLRVCTLLLVSYRGSLHLCSSTAASAQCRRRNQRTHQSCHTAALPSFFSLRTRTTRGRRGPRGHGRHRRAADLGAGVQVAADNDL